MPKTVYGTLNPKSLAKTKNTTKTLLTIFQIERTIADFYLNILSSRDQAALQAIHDHQDAFYRSLTGLKETFKLYRPRGKQLLRFSPKDSNEKIYKEEELDLAFYVAYNSIPNRYGQLLYLLTKGLLARKVLEVGTFFGISTLYLLAALEKVKKHHLDSIEKWSFPKKYYPRIFSGLSTKSLNLINADSKKIIPELINQKKVFDLVFHDGTHLGPQFKQEATLILKVLSEEGLLIIDDINWSQPMRSAWRDLKREDNVVYSAEIGNGKMGLLLKGF